MGWGRNTLKQRTKLPVPHGTNTNTLKTLTLLEKVLPNKKWGHELVLCSLFVWFPHNENRQKVVKCGWGFFKKTHLFRKPKRKRNWQEKVWAKKIRTPHKLLFEFLSYSRVSPGFFDFPGFETLESLWYKAWRVTEEKLVSQTFLCLFFLRRIFAWGWLKYSYLTTKASLLGAWLTI